MSDRAQRFEAFLDELGPLVDGDPEVLARQADFLADDDDARDVRHEASLAAQTIAIGGADYEAPADFEARILAAIDGAASEGAGRSTNPGFFAGEQANMVSEGDRPTDPAASEPPAPFTAAIPDTPVPLREQGPPLSASPPAAPGTFAGNPSSGATPPGTAPVGNPPVGNTATGNPGGPTATMPAANMPAANMPAANMPAATMPAANMPAANMPASNMPDSNMPASNTGPIAEPAHLAGWAAPSAAPGWVSPPALSETRGGTAPTQALPSGQIPSQPGVITQRGPFTGTAVVESPLAAPKPQRKMGRLLILPVVGALGLAVAAAIGLALVGGDSVIDSDQEDDDSPTGLHGLAATLTNLDRASQDGQSGVTVRRPDSDSFVALAVGEDVPRGSVLRTDDRTRAGFRLSDGSEIVLNHETELALLPNAERGLRLASGELVADVAHLDDGPNAAFETPSGRVDVLGTKFVLTATDELTSVRVSRGSVSVASDDGEASNVNAGEEGLLRRGETPNVAPVTDVARTMAWSELGAEITGEDAEDLDTIAGIGSLRARRPGSRGGEERPLTLARHDVRIRIVGNVARTEIEEVFRNDGDEVLEGIYKFPLPPDAQIARLALDVEGRMEEGAFVERDRASRIWAGVIRNVTPVAQRQNDEEFIWVPGPWADPAILEWQRGGQFELRVFPIPAHGERRVILGYNQTVAPQGARRRYVYPMAHSADDSTRVSEFNVDVRVAGAEHVQANGYRVTANPDEGATRLRFQETNFSPKGDLVIDYQLPGEDRSLRWWAYQGDAALAPPENARDQDQEVLALERAMASDARPYVAFALRPELPRNTQRAASDYVFMVDASQSMVGERYQRASRLTTRVVREMDRRDRFMVLACDYQCRAMPGGLQAPTTQAANAAETWLATVEPAGASDLVATLGEAAAMVEGERREGRDVHLVYIGDGVSSVGYRRAGSISREVAAVGTREHVSVSTVGIGGDADSMILRSVARAAGGHYVPYVPGQRVSVAALTVLETSYGTSLSSPRLELPSGIVEVAPEELPTIRAGEEVIVVARLDQPTVSGEIVLRGSVGDQPFEQRYPIQVQPSNAAGNRFVPQLWAAGRIEDLQLRDRGEDRAKIIAMSKAYGVMSRHTSLLVLESEAMFRAFRVDRREATQQWTGEEDVVEGDSDQAVQAAIGGGRGRGHRPPPRPARSFANGNVPGDMAPAPRPMMDAPGNSFGTRTGLGAGPRTMSRDDDMGDSLASATEAEEAPRRRENRAASPAMVMAPEAQAPIMRPAPQGQWMRRTSVRVANLSSSATPTPAEERQADEADAALEQNLDSRDRHRAAVRQLTRVGRLNRALEIAELWVGRDRLDPEALTAKADILGRLGRRDEALRLLTGTVDLVPDSETLHARLASAFDRVGRPERACAHRVALAEIDEADPARVAAAMRCERAVGRNDEAERLVLSLRDPSVRTRAERLLAEEESIPAFRGDFTVDARWSGTEDLDVSIVTADGTRLSWMGGRTSVVGESANAGGEERLGLRWTGTGNYIVEINRTNPTDTREIQGRIELTVLGERRTVPFRLTDVRAPVARVRVSRESRLERVTGSVPF